MAYQTEPLDADEITYRLKLAVARELAHGVFRDVLKRPCGVHGAQPGEPCWTLGDDFPALCGKRVRSWSDRRIPATKSRRGRAIE